MMNSESPVGHQMCYIKKRNTALNPRGHLAKNKSRSGFSTSSTLLYLLYESESVPTWRLSWESGPVSVRVSVLVCLSCVSLCLSLTKDFPQEGMRILLQKSFTWAHPDSKIIVYQLASKCYIQHLWWWLTQKITFSLWICCFPKANDTTRVLLWARCKLRVHLFISSKDRLPGGPRQARFIVTLSSKQTDWICSRAALLSLRWPPDVLITLVLRFSRSSSLLECRKYFYHDALSFVPCPCIP